MQKLLCALLASTVSASELFLAQKPNLQLDKDLIQASLNIDINANSIVPCQYITKTSVFSFGNVIDPSDLKLSSNTTQIPPAAVTFTTGEKAIFNFCETPFDGATQAGFTNENCVGANSNSFISDGDSCHGLNAQNDTEVGDTAGFEIMNSDQTVTGISLIYSGGSCGTGKYNLNVTSMCPAEGKKSTATPVITDHFITGACNYTIVYDTVAGCPVFSLSQLSKFFQKYSYLFGAFLIVAGFFLSFFGNKFVNIVIFLVGASALIIILSGLFINLALDKVDEEWVVWVAFIAIALISFGVGFLLVKFRRYGIGLFAGWGGVMLGFVVTTTFAVKNQYAFYAIIIAAAIGMFFIAVKVEKTAIILLTAFIGAYAFVRGISLYAGGFPSETELHDELEAGVITWETMPKTYYAYLGGILLLFIISTVYQVKNNKEKEEDRAKMKVFMK